MLLSYAPASQMTRRSPMSRVCGRSSPAERMSSSMQMRPSTRTGPRATGTSWSPATRKKRCGYTEARGISAMQASITTSWIMPSWRRTSERGPAASSPDVGAAAPALDEVEVEKGLAPVVVHAGRLLNDAGPGEDLPEHRGEVVEEL